MGMSHAEDVMLGESKPPALRGRVVAGCKNGMGCVLFSGLQCRQACMGGSITVLVWSRWGLLQIAIDGALTVGFGP